MCQDRLIEKGLLARNKEDKRNGSAGDDTQGESAGRTILALPSGIQRAFPSDVATGVMSCLSQDRAATGQSRRHPLRADRIDHGNEGQAKTGSQ